MQVRLTAAALAAFLLCGSAAQAAPVCGPREAIARRLADGYGEVPVAAGATAAGTLVELFRSDIGSFTLVVTRPDGLACLMAAGEGWEAVAPNPQDGRGET